MEAWREELYLQHGLFDNLRQKAKSAASIVRSTASNAYATVKKTSNTAANSIKTKAGDINREWKNHKYIRKEEKGNKVRYIYPEDLNKKSRKKDNRLNVHTIINSFKDKSVSSIVNKPIKSVINKAVAFVDNLSYTSINTIKDLLNTTYKEGFYRYDIFRRPAEVSIPSDYIIPETSLIPYKTIFDATINSFTELHKKKKEMTRDVDQAMVNPLYGTDPAYGVNCALCSGTYELRRRGYDVEAMPNHLPNFDIDTTYLVYMNSWFKNPIINKIHSNSGKYEAFSSKEIKEVESQILKEGNGSRGFLDVKWISGGAHSVIWEVENNEVIIRDCQTNRKKTLNDVLSRAYDGGYFRTDNIELNDDILRCVRNSIDWKNYQYDTKAFYRDVAYKSIGYKDADGDWVVKKSTILKENDKFITVKLELKNGTTQTITYKKKGNFYYEISVKTD